MIVSFTSFKKVLILWLLCAVSILSKAQNPLFQYSKLLSGDSIVFTSQGLHVGNPINPKKGTLTKTLIQNSLYRFVYKPNPAFEGRDTFLVNCMTPLSTYYGYIVEVKETFVFAKNDFSFTDINTDKIINVLSNDSSTTSNLSIHSLNAENGGTAILENGNIKFTPYNGFSGVAKVNYTVCDEFLKCDESNVYVAVYPSNLSDDTLKLFTKKGNPLSVVLPSNGFSVLQSPNKGGSITTLASNAFDYHPVSNYVGKETFSFSNGNVTRYVLVEVLNYQSPNKFVVNDVVYTSLNKSITFNVQNNDLEKNKFIINSYTSSPDAQSIAQVNGVFTVVPKTGFKGIIKFTYNAKYSGPVGNNIPANETGTIFVVVGNQGPTKNTYNMKVVKDLPHVLRHKVNISNYDFSILSAPAHGSLNYYPGYNNIVINGKNVSGYNLLIYNPNSGYLGQDACTLQYCVEADCKQINIDLNVQEEATSCFDECVWAGDVNTDGIVDVYDALPLGYFIGKSGEERDNNNSDWYPQTANNWNNPFVDSVTDLKHADTDGDGTITIADTSAILQSYSYTHNLTSERVSTFKLYPLDIVPRVPGPYKKGDKVLIDIILGVPQNPAIDINGIAFNLNFDPSVINPDSTIVAFHEGWLSYNAPFFQMMKKPSLGKVDAVVSRVGAKPASGIGSIGVITAIVENDIAGIQNDKKAYLYSIQNIQMMDGTGEVSYLPSVTKELNVGGKRPQLDEQLLSVFPNPTKSWLTLNLGGGYEIQQISILNTQGQLISEMEGNMTNFMQINVESLDSGLYLMNIKTEGGLIHKKIEVIK